MPPAPSTRYTGRPDADASSIDALERIPFLPETAVAGGATLPRRHRRAPAGTSTVAPGRYLGLYLKYVALFVGAGLISGSIVHYPLDETRYMIIGAVGAMLFALASTFGDARAQGSGVASLVRFVVASLVLALGIGMISGGIQHFSDIPTRAATLIPLGGALSILAFAVRDGHRLSARGIAPFAIAVGAVLLWLAIGLGAYAKSFDAPAAGADHHGAGEDATTGASADEHVTESAAGTAAGRTDAPAAAADSAETAGAVESTEASALTGAAGAAEDHAAHGH